MRARNEQDEYGRPQCHVCGQPIRSIETVPAPGGEPVHFYCFPVTRAKAAQASEPRESVA